MTRTSRAESAQFHAAAPGRPGRRSGPGRRRRRRNTAATTLAGWLRLADRTRAAAAELLALAAPVSCVCCGAEDLALCGACARQVRLLTRNPFRAEAQAPALMDMDGSVLLPVVAAGVYRGELAQAVLSFKRYGQGQLGRVLAQGPRRGRERRRGGVSQGSGWCRYPRAAAPSGNGASARSICCWDGPERYQPAGASERAGAAASGRRPAEVGVTRARALPRAWALAAIPERRGQTGSRAGGQKGLGRGARAARVRGSMRAGRRPGCAGAARESPASSSMTCSPRAPRLPRLPVPCSRQEHWSGAPSSWQRHARRSLPTSAPAAARGWSGRAASRKKINQKRMNNGWL